MLVVGASPQVASLTAAGAAGAMPHGGNLTDVSIMRPRAFDKTRSAKSAAEPRKSAAEPSSPSLSIWNNLSRKTAALKGQASFSWSQKVKHEKLPSRQCDRGHRFIEPKAAKSTTAITHRQLWSALLLILRSGVGQHGSLRPR